MRRALCIQDAVVARGAPVALLAPPLHPGFLASRWGLCIRRTAGWGVPQTTTLPRCALAATEPGEHPRWAHSGRRVCVGQVAGHASRGQEVTAVEQPWWWRGRGAIAAAAPSCLAYLVKDARGCMQYCCTFLFPAALLFTQLPRARASGDTTLTPASTCIINHTPPGFLPGPSTVNERSCAPKSRASGGGWGKAGVVKHMTNELKVPPDP